MGWTRNTTGLLISLWYLLPDISQAGSILFSIARKEPHVPGNVNVLRLERAVYLCIVAMVPVLQHELSKIEAVYAIL